MPELVKLERGPWKVPNPFAVLACLGGLVNRELNRPNGLSSCELEYERVAGQGGEINKAISTMRHMRIDPPHHLFLLPSIILGMEF